MFAIAIGRRRQYLQHPDFPDFNDDDRDGGRGRDDGRGDGDRDDGGRGEMPALLLIGDSQPVLFLTKAPQCEDLPTLLPSSRSRGGH